MRDEHADVAIIGAGIVGLAVGLQLVRQSPDLKVLILEKEREVAAHQTGHNSGVIHSGMYYKPGSLKARLCVEGAAAMVRFCQEHGIPYEICGKVIVATSAEELAGLEEILRRGRANGVPNLRELTAEQIREIEPHAAGIRGIHVPGTGITDFRMVAQKYAELICGNGGAVLTDTEITQIVSSPDEIVLETAARTVHARYVVNCAGLRSDRIAAMAGASLGLRIVPFRGEYYEVVPAKHHLIRGLIYPVPDPRFPFLGVHFTKRIHGGVEAGPNAVLALKREGYSRTSFDIADTASMAAFAGFWKMASKYWKMGFEELYRSWSKHAFTVALQKLLPELTSDDIRAGGSGVRAQAVDKSGKLLDDFHFVYQNRILHVCNVPSPAATASLVIGREIVATLSRTDSFFEATASMR
ncbi:MAG TPA: L-2-hydroxyglutarate oxidase [Acidobacteriaceae bacterium]|nr:L-2-hydroxyglutarate oxidase [Acidobacteriaceae bacterium]